MRALQLHSFGSLKSNYWQLRALMAIGAIVVSFAIVTVDRQLGIGRIDHPPLLYANEPAGARALHSTIASSMITVADVTFYITIAALATTAATFGPRLINNFIRAVSNQITLGTFIATFLYCLLVLRTVQTGDEASAVFVQATEHPRNVELIEAVYGDTVASLSAPRVGA